ncbi:MAG: L-threonylcarbamoyladenylate synthase type 1 TsaC, partial [Bacteroidetes bacterium]|nr:L-threonylcarbamoyladenylate synthase type 1 TsaC [Bacteroidota bacterium]
VGLLLWTALPDFRHHSQRILAPGGKSVEGARRLFAALYELDQMHLDLILAQPAPEEGLGRAINDRLRKAAAQ